MAIESAMGNMSGALLDLMTLTQDLLIRSQTIHMLKRREAEIRRMMPKAPAPFVGPINPQVTMGPARDTGVLVVVWVNTSKYPDPAGGYLRVFKRVDLIGPFHNMQSGIDTFNHTIRIDSVEDGYVSVPYFLWLYPGARY